MDTLRNGFSHFQMRMGEKIKKISNWEIIAKKIDDLKACDFTKKKTQL